MPNQPQGRRAFLKQVTALGTAAIPAAALLNAGCATQAPAQGSRSKTVYNPAAAFEIKVSETEYRRSSAGHVLLARIYAAQGAGPFPALLDLHGGAWNNKDRFANEPMDRAIAASGVVVVAIDMTLAPEAPYPASVQDGNYGVRWLKAKAADWNGEAAN